MRSHTRLRAIPSEVLMTGDHTYTDEWLQARKAYLAATETFTEQARVLCLMFDRIQATKASSWDRVRIAAQLAKECRARQAYLEAQNRIRQLLPLP